jgi:hypothetical protein
MRPGGGGRSPAGAGNAMIPQTRPQAGRLESTAHFIRSGLSIACARATWLMSSRADRLMAPATAGSLRRLMAFSRSA